MPVPSSSTAISVPPGVEAPVLELRRAEERGGERRQQVRRARRVGSPEPIVEASTSPGAPASDPETTSEHEPQAVDPDAGELRRVRVEPGRVQPPAGRGVLEQEPHRDGDHEHVDDRGA